MVTGASLAYVAGSGHIPIPLATDQPRRTAHEPTRPKPTGLDWDALRPTCTSCSTKSSEVLNGRCPTCRGVKPTKTKAKKPSNSGRMVFEHLDDDAVERRFTAPTGARAALADDLDHLEHDDPDVATAAATLDDIADQIVRPDDHVRPEHLAAVPDDLPPTSTSQEATVTSPPFPTYIVDIAVVLRDSEDHPDTAVRTARKAVANALVGLNRELKRYGDPAASTLRAPAPTGVRIPPPVGTRSSKLRPHHAELISAYLTGTTTTDLGRRYDVSPSAIGQYLRRHGIPTRNTTTGAATA